MVLLFAWLVWTSFSIVVMLAFIFCTHWRLGQLSVGTLSETIEATALASEECRPNRGCWRRRKIHLSYTASGHEIVKMIDCYHQHAAGVDTNEDDKLECVMVPGCPFSVALPQELIDDPADANNGHH